MPELDSAQKLLVIYVANSEVERKSLRDAVPDEVELLTTTTSDKLVEIIGESKAPTVLLMMALSAVNFDARTHFVRGLRQVGSLLPILFLVDYGVNEVGIVGQDVGEHKTFSLPRADRLQSDLAKIKELATDMIRNAGSRPEWRAAVKSDATVEGYEPGNVLRPTKFTM